MNCDASSNVRYLDKVYDGGYRIAENHQKLEFDDFIILVNYSEIPVKVGLKNLLDKYRLNCILDLRLSPRLDKFAESRSRALSILNDHEVTYIDALGLLDINVVTDFFDLSEDRMEKLALLIDDKSGAKGSFMFIFDNRDILEICKEVFSNKIFNNLGERISKYSAEFKEGLLSVVY